MDCAERVLEAEFAQEQLFDGARIAGQCYYCNSLIGTEGAMDICPGDWRRLMMIMMMFGISRFMFVGDRIQ